MADLVARLTGEDNLSGTLNKVKNELKDIGKETSNIDKIDAKFNKITQSTAPLKKQLKDLKGLMAQMNMEGLGNTEQYTKIAQEAGKIKDAMDDAAAATKRFSSDTIALDMGVQSLQAITAGAQVATGAMNLFGVENENVQKAMLQVQNLLMIGNGLQQLHTLLINKDSLAQQLLSASTKKATAAQVSQTTATKAGTLAQIKLNLAVLANPYVLAAAAIAALAAGIVYWISTMDDATEAEEGLKEAEEAVINATNDSEKEYIKARMEMDQLKTSLDNFNGSKEDEKRLVDELNNKYGNTIGKYKDLESWTAALGNVSFYYCGVMKQQAKLAALNAVAYEAWAKAMAGEDVEKNMAMFHKLEAEAEVAAKDLAWWKQELNRARKLAGDTSLSSPTSSGSGKSTKTTKPTKGGGSGSSTEAKGLIGKLEKEIKDLQTQINEATTEDLIKNLNDQLKNKQKELHELKVRVGLEEEEEDPVEKLNSELQELFNNSNTKIQIPASSFEIAQNRGKASDPLEDLKAQMDSNDAMMDSLAELAGKYEEIGATGTEEYQKLIDKIYELIEAQRLLADQVEETTRQQEEKDERDREEEERIEVKKKLYEDLMSTAQSLGSGLKSLGEEEAAAAIQIATVTAQAVKEIIPQIMALIGAKQGEALASGTASAAGLPFPANIAAIAAIVAQIMAVFATIASVAGSFASGGIIGGGNMYGDHVLARVNSGEMVLNKSQQGRLFKAIESGNIGGGSTVLVPDFRIKGSDLYCSLRNYSKSVGKTGKITGIR